MSNLVQRDFISYTDLLPSQFNNSVKLQTFLNAFQIQDQHLSDEIYKLAGSYDVVTATGAYLDTLGKLLSVERLGRSDDKYRLAILTAIIEMVGSGTHKDIHEFLKITTNSTKTKFHDYHPSKYVVTFDGAYPEGGYELGYLAGLAVSVDDNSASGIKCLGISHDAEGKAHGFAEVSEVPALFRTNGAGESFMQCGEVFAQCLSIPLDPEYTLNTQLWSVYPEEGVVTGIVCAGDDLMQCGEPTAQCTRFTEEDPFTEEGYGFYAEFYEVQ